MIWAFDYYQIFNLWILHIWNQTRKREKKHWVCYFLFSLLFLRDNSFSVRLNDMIQCMAQDRFWNGQCNNTSNIKRKSSKALILKNSNGKQRQRERLRGRHPGRGSGVTVNRIRSNTYLSHYWRIYDTIMAIITIKTST